MVFGVSRLHNIVFKSVFALSIALSSTRLFAQQAEQKDQIENAFAAPEQPIAKAQDCQWALDQLQVREAWHLLSQQGYSNPGQGITLAQLDTGIIPLRSLMKTSDVSQGAWGLQFSPGQTALLPGLLNFVQPNLQPLDNDPNSPSFGHGTSTASLIVGWMPETGFDWSFIGIAPWVKLIPLKVTDSVVMVGNMSTGGTADLKNLAEGIHAASRMGAQIITISLGALFDSSNLIQEAVKEAIENGIIVIAAAGQTVPINMIPLPARLPGVIAVTASTRKKTHWNEAFVGRHIAFAAPGAGVCHITAQPTQKPLVNDSESSDLIQMNARNGGLLKFTEGLRNSSGTSYSTAFTAAAAALWLQRHNREELARLYGKKNISALFERVARTFAMETPPDWNTQRTGAGILNINRLLAAPLPCESKDTFSSCAVKSSSFLTSASR